MPTAYLKLDVCLKQSACLADSAVVLNFVAIGSLPSVDFPSAVAVDCVKGSSVLYGRICMAETKQLELEVHADGQNTSHSHRFINIGKKCTLMKQLLYGTDIY